MPITTTPAHHRNPFQPVIRKVAADLEAEDKSKDNEKERIRIK